MARGTLHAPKTENRRRTNAPVHGKIELVRDGVVRGSSLQDASGRADWNPLTIDWWETWRRMPQASIFEPTDWQRLLVLAFLLDSYWLKPQAASLSEIRQNEERLGGTVMDRVRAQMTFTDEQTTLASVTTLPGADEGDEFEGV